MFNLLYIEAYNATYMQYNHYTCSYMWQGAVHRSLYVPMVMQQM